MFIRLKCSKYFPSISNSLTTGKVLPEFYLKCDECFDILLLSCLPVNQGYLT